MDLDLMINTSQDENDYMNYGNRPIRLYVVLVEHRIIYRQKVRSIWKAEIFIFKLALQQLGFLTNLNHLIPWNNNQTSTTNAGGGVVAQYHQQRTAAIGSYKNNLWD